MAEVQVAPCDHTITIAVQPNRKFTYKLPDGSDAKELEVERNQWVCWECEQGPFAVNFGFRSPCEGTGKNAPSGGTIRLKVKGRDVVDDRYKYFVGVCIGHEELLLDDPDLIVRP